VTASPDAYSVADFVSRWRDVKATSAALEGPSLADRLALCELDEPGTIERLQDKLGPAGCLMLAYDAGFWLRPKQLAPVRTVGAWRIFLIVAGRGWGKTQTAAEWVVERILRGAREIVLAGPNLDDVKQFMVGGHKRRCEGGNGSGLLDVLPPWIRYHYKEDDGIIEFPDHYAVVYLHSAEVPEFRGPNPDTVWGDEPIKWRYGERLLSNLRLACRSVGKVEPQILLTTSPKRLKLLRDLVMEPGVVTVHGRTDENRGNVHEGWFQDQARRLAGSRQGEEELGGELGADDGSELFPLSVIDKNRIASERDMPELDRVVVAVDPSFSTHRKSDDTGVVAAGMHGDASDGTAYVLADVTGRFTPEQYGEEAWRLLEKLGASAFVVEKNHIGEHAASTLRAAGWKRGWRPIERKHGGRVVGVDMEREGRKVQILEVLAQGDKASRASPVSTLYAQGRVRHVGVLSRLETEMSEWDPATSRSPNGLDAVVHACVELFGLGRLPERDARAGVRGAGAVAAALRPEAPSPMGQMVPSSSVRGLAGALPRGGGWGSGL
jgi:phage terminase large subunit-like protein